MTMAEFSTTLRYNLELAVDIGDGTLAEALEVGPFPSERAALRFADNVGNLPAHDVVNAADWDGVSCGYVDDAPDDDSLIVAGATLNVYTDRWGTDYDLTRDLY